MTPPMGDPLALAGADRLRALLAWATPSPWSVASKPSSVAGWPVCGELGTVLADVSTLSVPGVEVSREAYANAALIVAAVNALPGLLDERDALKGALEDLSKSAGMLHANAMGCAQNHYGEDFYIHGMPGWLADCAASISRARAAIEAVGDVGEGE